ncbi:MAG: FixH family protein [Melioribacteraceae bacterium]
MKLKLNWGFGIAAVYSLFLIGTLIMVIIFMNQDVSLESKDYYAKGIKYQDEIDKMKRTKELPEQLDITVEQNSIILSFPKIFKSTELNGKIYFYRPSDDSRDFTIDIAADSSSVQSIPTKNLIKGLWRVKVNWNGKGNSFLDKKIVMIN